MLRTRCALVLGLLAAPVPLVGCAISPLSRTPAESTSAVTLKGYTLSPGQTVTIQAVDQNTGNVDTRGTATAGTSGTSYKTSGGTSYTLYPWSFSAGVLPANFWAPQAIVDDLKTSQGRLEIFASVAGNNFLTFSEAAANSALASGNDPASAALQYSDGNSTVLFDQSGVGSAAATTWVTVAGMISPSPSPSVYSSVAWSVGYYAVGGTKVYALICAPTTAGQYPVVVYNHGGIHGPIDLGSLHGSVTASGWTSAPPPAIGTADDLGQCVDWAKRGWIFAVSSYRGESIIINSASPEFQSNTWISDGESEFCLGEVNDVMALTGLLVNHIDSIMLGNTTQKVKINAANGKLFMYGYSHGGCITYRAVEQGAPVDAFAVIEGFTDMRMAYLTGLSEGLTPLQAAVGSGAFQPGTTIIYAPDAAGVMGYNWRSAHYFASRGDLSIQKFRTMPILILHGDIDTNNPVFLDQPALLAADIGATNIFVGPNGVSPPSSLPCIDGPVGAPLPPSLTAPNKSCPITFTLMNTGDPCVSGATPPPELGLCQVLMLPLPPPSGQPQQLHYFVVYHNMNHVNGGLAIKNTFDRFAEQNFDRKPGCDGLEAVCNAN